MEIKKVVFDENTFGITRTSLKMLRDTLARAIENHIAIFEIPTSDLCCGFLILDREREEAIFTGDGFRTDRGGEGGAGYKSAEVLFNLYGIRQFYWDDILDILNGSYQRNDIKKRLIVLAQEIANEFSDSAFVRPMDNNPQYIR